MVKVNYVCESDNIRIDRYLVEKLNINRSQIKKYIDFGNILINNSVVKAGYMTKIGDIIDVSYEDEILLLPEEIDFKIIYEDEHIAVISKPQNLVVHPGSGNYNHTLVNGLLFKFKNLSNCGDKLRPGIVHRLDKDTSGLMIIAKTNLAYLKLVKDFKESKIRKTYIAVVEGKTDEFGIINEPIGRDPKNRKKMAVIYENSKNAITEYKKIREFNNFSLISINILTGRTHQIRVHLSYIKHPVLGDLTYGNKNKYKIDKQMLHAYRLKFNHPITGEELSFEDDIPNRFVKFLSRKDIWKI